ncbi:hypothetical protein DDE74_00205 [Streptomyces lydicus]|uniref:Uncharacterized protein n=1 Tax=Streptomyces lydicus TaxID=47763 RepID=A0A3S9Y3P8_9ACTN|nr:hypothetical protein [Streptomyces lydicus]AZS69620.1 hypothetical protein DDE74_00205 [Streptomyces lydicus]
MTTEPPDRRTATAQWGPVAWSYTAGDDAETARVAAQLVTTTPSVWPSYGRIRLRVRSTCDRAALDRLERVASGPARRLREENYRRAPDGTWLSCGNRPADAAEPALPRHAVGHQNGQWTILHDDGSGTEQRARTGDIVLRALVSAALTALGGLTVHASAATGRDGRAVVFLGDSGTGKSTLALRLARAGGCLVSGDRTLLVPGPGGWWAVGAGLLPRFRWGTLEGLGLAMRVRDAALLRHGDGRCRLADLPRTPDKVVFTPAESERVLDVRTADCAPLGKLVVLSPAEGDVPAARAVTPEATAAAVRAHSLSSDAGCLVWPFPIRPAQVRGVAGLVEEVAGSALAWDPVPHRAEDALLRVLADAPGAPPSGRRSSAP